MREATTQNKGVHTEHVSAISNSLPSSAHLSHNAYPERHVADAFLCAELKHTTVNALSVVLVVGHFECHGVCGVHRGWTKGGQNHEMRRKNITQHQNETVVTFNTTAGSGSALTKSVQRGLGKNDCKQREHVRERARHCKTDRNESVVLLSVSEIRSSGHTL